ncbi:MAG TPA: ubiquinol-cytochrome c reductase iron-sulfur subunit [Pseudomonadales bacterium]|nr:ubiquinol-cytochrome c reductase iron-sulfur subunit [Pseudomonadales bacterium]
MTNDGINHARRRFLTVATTGVGVAGAGFVATPFVGSWNPSAKAKAAGAPVKINISKLESGQMVTEEWQGKPVYVIRRTPDMIASLAKMTDRLKDPSSLKSEQPAYCKNEHRSIKSEILVLVGLCTHLGCAPKKRFDVAPEDLGKDWVGGFFCPCHGSKFDLAGRVLQNVPAPSNLTVPPYRFDSDSIIVIGEDQKGAV